MKRFFDLTLSAFLLVLVSPIMGLIGLLVRSDTPGPAIYRQARIGRAGSVFTIYKFRTMRFSSTGSLVTHSADSRITRSGRWLRASKLDELPQLWNVMRGDMSLVGPRPEVPQFVEEWPMPIRERVLSIRPGITDPASIMYRDESDLLGKSSDPLGEYLNVVMPAKLRIYEEYVQSHTFTGDLKILGLTLRKVIRA